jgi:hypothetical protein
VWSWEVHSDVGLVGAGGNRVWGVVGRVCGGDAGLKCCFGMFRVQMGWQRVGVFYLSPRDSHSHGPTGSGLSSWRTGARGGWYLCVVAVLRFRCWIGHEHPAIRQAFGRTKPVRGDSVSRRAEGPCGEAVLLGYAASVVWNVMSS